MAVPIGGEYDINIPQIVEADGSLSGGTVTEQLEADGADGFVLVLNVGVTRVRLIVDASVDNDGGPPTFVSVYVGTAGDEERWLKFEHTVPSEPPLPVGRVQ